MHVCPLQEAHTVSVPHLAVVGGPTKTLIERLRNSREYSDRGVGSSGDYVFGIQTVEPYEGRRSGVALPDPQKARHFVGLPFAQQPNLQMDHNPDWMYVKRKDVHMQYPQLSFQLKIIWCRICKGIYGKYFPEDNSS